MSNNFTSHFSADDAALLLIDFQPQMFMGVESHDRNAIKNNLQIIAKSAKLFNVPTILSTVAAETFAGPFVPEVAEEVFPGHEIVDRTSINAWLTPNFVKAVEATVRNRLVIAGLWTGACAAFNVIEGLRRGYEVFFVADACGDSSIQAHERAVDPHDPGRRRANHRTAFRLRTTAGLGPSGNISGRDGHHECAHRVRHSDLLLQVGAGWAR
jgi:nicotinamidase-related amidase